MPDQMADSPDSRSFAAKQHDESVVQHANLTGGSRSETPLVASTHEPQASPNACLLDLKLDLRREAREQGLVPGSNPVASSHWRLTWRHENGVGGVVSQNLLEVASIVRCHDAACDGTNLPNP